MSHPDMLALIARHTPTEGVHLTAIDGLELFRISEPVERIQAVYSPSICAIMQGSKRTYLGGTAHIYDSSHYLCATMPLPVEAEICFATPEAPVLGLIISLESQVMAETLFEYGAIEGPVRRHNAPGSDPGLMVAACDDAFTSALSRLLMLLDDPLARHILSASRLRELLFTVLRGKAGPLIRHTLGTPHSLSRTLSYMRDNLRKPLSVDDLAQHAGMSRAAFDRRFRAVTTHSPLQFTKALRLNDAAMRIVQGHSINHAADSVGYQSSSQFSREFRRHFGASPRAWAKKSK